MEESDLTTPASKEDNIEKKKSSNTGKEKRDASVGGTGLWPSLPRVSKTNHKVIPEGTGKKEVDSSGTLSKKSQQTSQ